MTNNQSDELLREVLGVLREIKDRLPERTEAEPQQSEPKSVVVTGEGSPPVTAAKKAVPGRRR